MRVVAIGGVVLVAMVVAACGPAPLPTPTPPPGENQDVGAAPGGTVLRVSIAPADDYRTGEEDHSRTRLAREVEEQLPMLTASRCLERAATEYARLSLQSPGHLPLAAAEFLIHWTGCPDATVAVATVQTPIRGLQPLVDHLRHVLGTEPYTHVGIGSAVMPDRAGTRWIALLSRRRFTLQPVPRQAALGGSLTLQFTMDGALASPRVISTLPGGWTRESSAGSAGTVGVAAVPLSQVPGEQWVELVAEGERGPEVVALFPVAVGGSPPAEFSWQDPAPEATDVGSAEAQLTALVDEVRRRHNLPPLEVDERLVALARAHSQDMASNDYTGHTSPSAGDIARRFQKAGYLARSFGENVARGPSIGEIHEGLMRSPGHRANTLSPRFTALGIGVVQRPAALGGREWVVTEEFAEPLTRTRPEAIETRLRVLVEEESRGARSQQPLHAEELDGVARELARARLDGTTDASVLSRLAAQRAEALGVGFSRVSLIVGTAFAPEDVTLPSGTDVATAHQFGAGAAATADRSRPMAYVLLLVR